MKSYTKKHSVLVDVLNDIKIIDTIELTPWRFEDGQAPDEAWKRLIAIKELSNHLVNQGVATVAGEVLSGTLFAQTIADTSRFKIQASYLSKPGYKVLGHNYSPISDIIGPWVLVDDIIASGATIRRVARSTNNIPAPMAIIVMNSELLPCYFMPKKWTKVPVMKLQGRIY